MWYIIILYRDWSQAAVAGQNVGEYGIDLQHFSR